MNRLALKLLGVIGLLGFGLPGLGPGAAQASEAWNPRPANGDVIFPLPCDQKIVFRRILTSESGGSDAASILGDVRIRLGSPSREKAYLDYLRDDFIAGNFLLDRGRFYLIGKYETTIAQYKAVVNEGCAFADDDDIMPASRVSWYDAATFARRLTAHLLKTAKDQLKRETGTTKAFARLPTEAEWEFAARGGLAVSVADFQADRFPMQGPLINYAWVNDPMSAENVNPIGARDPNPLKLHDVYGNLSEMVFEPFRMNKAGRLHGLAGGVILKGGSFQSNPGFVTSSTREEDTLFNDETGEERRLRTTGFRVAIVGPALPTQTDVSALVDEWSRASVSRLSGTSDPLAMIAKVREGVSDLQILNGLSSIEQAVRAQTSGERDDQKQLLGGLLTTLGTMVADIRTLQKRTSARTRLMREGVVRRLDPKEFAGLEKQNDTERGRILDMVPFTHEVIVLIANSFPPEEIGAQAEATAGALRLRGFDEIAGGALLGAQIAADAARQRRPLTRPDVLDRIERGQ
ncbi:formylglycine-generating enzyme family protein [Xanthobacteraceae bacterium A53D]